MRKRSEKVRLSRSALAHLSTISEVRLRDYRRHIIENVVVDGVVEAQIIKAEWGGRDWVEVSFKGEVTFSITNNDGEHLSRETEDFEAKVTLSITSADRDAVLRGILDLDTWERSLFYQKKPIRRLKRQSSSFDIPVQVRNEMLDFADRNDAMFEKAESKWNGLTRISYIIATYEDGKKYYFIVSDQKLVGYFDNERDADKAYKALTP